MKFVINKISGFGITKQKYTLDPEKRFINFDGSTYGTQSLTRFFSRPTVIGGTILGLFCAAGHTMLQPEEVRQATFIRDFIFCLPDALLSNAFLWSGFNRELPVSKDSAIDLDGRMTTNPMATIKMASHYRMQQ